MKYAYIFQTVSILVSRTPRLERYNVKLWVSLLVIAIMNW